MDIELKLTQNDVKVILDALSGLPYRAVSPTISSILVQLNEKLSAPGEETAKPDAE